MNNRYLRDGRAPIPARESTSRVMKGNKGKNTKPEISVRKLLWNNNFKGYRLHWNKVPGRPDIAFPGKKIAIFVNGCYWHRCPICQPPLPKSNSIFWKEKFDKNVERDNRKHAQLKDLNWKVLVIWECQVKNESLKVLEDVRQILYDGS